MVDNTLIGSIWSREDALSRLRDMNGDNDKINQWNKYRHDHPQWGNKEQGPNLSDSDNPTDLRGVKLAFKDPSGIWHGIDLSGLWLFAVDFTNADLHAVNLSGAMLSHAHLDNVQLKYSNLSNANLRDADLPCVSLYRAIVNGADFRGADLSSAHVFEIKYKRKEMVGCYLGVRGLDSCFGDAFFRRDAIDQDFIDTVRFRRKFLYLLWKLTDFGRGLGRVVVLALLISLCFGLVFMFAREAGLCWLDYSGSANTMFTPFYFSIVTYTTLGFGDVTPLHWIGEILVMLEVILGYGTLGLILAILANKVARRA